MQTNQDEPDYSDPVLVDNDTAAVVEPNEQAGDDAAYPPPLSFQPDTLAETTRKSGLAWSAGIVFFSSIAFTLVIGWFADLLLGTSPWGIVGGIVLGSVMGFIQFFRITSRIFQKTTPDEASPLTLTSNDDEK